MTRKFLQSAQVPSTVSQWLAGRCLASTGPHARIWSTSMTRTDPLGTVIVNESVLFCTWLCRATATRWLMTTSRRSLRRQELHHWHASSFLRCAPAELQTRAVVHQDRVPQAGVALSAATTKCAHVRRALSYPSGPEQATTGVTLGVTRDFRDERVRQAWLEKSRDYGIQRSIVVSGPMSNWSDCYVSRVSCAEMKARDLVRSYAPPAGY